MNWLILAASLLFIGWVWRKYAESAERIRTDQEAADLAIEKRMDKIREEAAAGRRQHKLHLKLEEGTVCFPKNRDFHREYLNELPKRTESKSEKPTRIEMEETRQARLAREKKRYEEERDDRRRGSSSDDGVDFVDLAIGAYAISSLFDSGSSGSSDSGYSGSDSSSDYSGGGGDFSGGGSSGDW